MRHIASILLAAMLGASLACAERADVTPAGGVTRAAGGAATAAPLTGTADRLLSACSAHAMATPSVAASRMGARGRMGGC